MGAKPQSGLLELRNNRYENKYIRSILRWSCFINGKISEQQIDFVKEVISKFREAEIDHLTMSPSEKEELKNQWKKWLDTTTHGIKDELRAEGKLK